jgi:SANTA (SANT Associated)
MEQREEWDVMESVFEGMDRYDVFRKVGAEEVLRSRRVDAMMEKIPGEGAETYSSMVEDLLERGKERWEVSGNAVSINGEEREGVVKRERLSRWAIKMVALKGSYSCLHETAQETGSEREGAEGSQNEEAGLNESESQRSASREWGGRSKRRARKEEGLKEGQNQGVREMWLVVVGVVKDSDTITQSSFIRKRLGGRTVQSKNTVYELEGEFDETFSPHPLFSHESIQRFKDGFPENWKEIIGMEEDRIREDRRRKKLSLERRGNGDGGEKRSE